MSKAKRSKVTPPPPTPEGPSSRYRFFCWAIAFLGLAQLMVGLDYITIWPGAEAHTIWTVMQGHVAGYLPTTLLSALETDAKLWLIAYRLPALLVFLLGIWLFFRWGSSLFGRTNVEVTLLLVAASFFLTSIAKTGALDSWRLGLELGAWLALIHYLKQPSRSWLIYTALLGGAAVAVGQWSSLLLFAVWHLGYYRLMVPSQPALSKAIHQPFIIIYIVFGLSWLLRYLVADSVPVASLFYFQAFQLTHLKLFGYTLLGLAPFLGFAFAALRDLFFKIKKGEELALLLAVALFGSLLAQSMLFPFLLTFLTAKQVQFYFYSEKYPWQDWVKTGNVLHLILVFIVVVLALLGGFFQYAADGFRAVLGCSAAYWMFSFVGVIGLYGYRRDYVLGGMTLAGVLAILFFWVQVYPFLHLQRNWPERMTTSISQHEPPVDMIRLAEDDEQILPIAPYLSRAGIRVNPEIPNAVSDLYLVPVFAADSLKTFQHQVSGWAGLWEAGNWGTTRAMPADRPKE